MTIVAYMMGLIVGAISSFIVSYVLAHDRRKR